MRDYIEHAVAAGEFLIAANRSSDHGAELRTLASEQVRLRDARLDWLRDRGCCRPLNSLDRPGCDWASDCIACRQCARLSRGS